MRRLLAYASAVVFTAAGVVAVMGLEAFISRPFFTALTISVMLSAWLGGLGPGLFASLLAALAINYFFQEPRYSFLIATVGDGVQLAIFTAAAILLSALVRSRERVRSEAAELIRLKSEFVGMVSHELRSPLASIRGSVDLLLDDEVGEIDARQRHFLEKIRRSTDRLSTMVNDLLGMGLLEPGRMELDLAPSEPGAVIQDAVATVASQFAKKDQHLEVRCQPDLPQIWLDKDRIEQVLINLLSNANKYTPSGSTVCVSARRFANEEPAVSHEHVEIVVSDNGPGLSTEDQHRVFDRFFRGGDSKAQQQHSGTGLGLSVAQSLVELHGGVLTVESERNKGATFRVKLPIRPLADG